MAFEVSAELSPGPRKAAAPALPASGEPAVCEAPAPAPIRCLVTESGMRVACYAVPLESVPADFFADPDGRWTFEELAEAAGFGPNDGVAIGALREPFNGHPDGAAVVTLTARTRPYVAIIECPIAFACAEPAAAAHSAA
ncbi:MAG: hypothetical protein DIU78_007585 [Pseudomonadota bacterium]|nr:MAG: hypothetical protein DIU78_08410 [Pseudomonadota bacterium]